MIVATVSSSSASRSPRIPPARPSGRGSAEPRASERGSAEVRAGLVLHRASLTAHARKLAKDAADAEDLMQDTALRALSFASSFEPGTNVRAWLHQILHSVFVTRCRRRGRERRGVDALAIDPCAWVRSEPPPVLAELSPRVERALMDLPSGFRDAVRLVDVLDLSYKDAARSLSVPLGTVMSRLHRGRRLLATVLSEPSETEKKAA